MMQVSCDRLPSSYPSFAIRCPKALKTVCGRREIVDRRDDHALISAAGHHRHHRRCHRTTIARRPATRTRGGRTEAQESRAAAHDVPVLPLACGLARRLALSRTLPSSTGVCNIATPLPGNRRLFTLRSTAQRAIHAMPCGRWCVESAGLVQHWSASQDSLTTSGHGPCG